VANKKLYPIQDPIALGRRYTNNLLAMTAEGLHDKSDIAQQLAWRDQQIDELTKKLEETQELNNASAIRHCKDLSLDDTFLWRGEHCTITALKRGKDGVNWGIDVTFITQDNDVVTTRVQAFSLVPVG